MNFDISVIPTILGVVSNMILGMIWYAPPVFGNMWMNTIGKKPTEEDKKNVGKMYAFTTVAALITSIIVGVMIKSLAIVDLGGAISFAILAWLGLCSATALPSYLFESRSLKAFAIYSGYQLVSLVLMAAIQILIK